ncbi:MAG: response regulator [Pseudomonadota bacterium]
MSKMRANLFAALPFRKKLTLLTGSSVALALLMACLGLFAFHYQTDQRFADQRHTQLASVIASNVGPAVFFNDRDVAFETLSSAKVIEDVRMVEVVSDDGQVFAQYKRALAQSGVFGGQSQNFERDIVIDGEKIGVLRMEVAQRSLLDILAETWGGIVGLLLLCLALTTMVSRLFSRLAFRPIQRLVGAMQKIARSSDFATRLPTEVDTDFAIISSSFNAMLAEIDRGNSQLQRTANELREARDEAQEANAAKSQFLANMSHELRTPLNAILGYAEVLKEELEAQGSEQSLEDVQWIHSSAQQLLGLINGILDLSKIEAGKMELDRHDFQIPALITEVGKMIEPLAAQKGNSLSVHVSPDLGKAFTDSFKLRQVLLNLGSNACKFTEQGQIMIAARASGDHVTISVSDTGIGMAADTIERLFQPFSQADTSTTRRFGGTGLGLAITRRFVDLLGGEIEVSSEAGMGSTFTFSVPLRAGEADRGLATEGGEGGVVSDRQAVAADVAGPHERDKPLALAIDDEPSSTQLMTRIAEQSGYDVLLATDGASGLDLMRKAKPDLVLLDLLMPHCDGWEVLAAAERDPVLSKIPVVVVSVSDEKRKTYDAGASDHLIKPISSQQVKEVLEQYAQRRCGKVLLVENDRATASLYARGLEQMGYEVEIAYDGASAFATLQSGDYETVVTDLEMVGASGFELIEKIRALPSESRPFVYVLTGLALEETQTEAIDRHVERIFKKNGLSPRQLAMEITARGDRQEPSTRVA